MKNESKVRAIAIYLPQYHPVPENDEWWGKGFTEWTNVAKAKPLFKGHHQPRLPGELGFYDLRVPEVREQQALLAKEYGIEGFMYWHYWFAGKRLLERPFLEVLDSGKPDFPFCLGWANESWTGVWHGLKNKILIEQTYPGKEDYENHFQALLSAFKDKRYITVDGKPLFLVYQPFQVPDSPLFIELWNRLAVKNGLKGIHFVACTTHLEKEEEALLSMGYSGIYFHRMTEVAKHLSMSLVKRELFNRGIYKNYTSNGIFKYRDLIKYLIKPTDCKKHTYPAIVPNWDNSPRSGRKSFIIRDSTPELFRRHLQMVFAVLKEKPEEDRIVFIKSWNEWAEGNYLEPDLQYGRQYLEVLKEEIDNFK
ncbi:MAG: glycoside hydrolase family 99-like domain-containing protein [Dysgonamonadaceae bacterium]|jgi:lipopolysaccharide biosynthesis protein|nr:glycoside hydrolase family 99-like domain-containing protein [Dysgonamonadaceae bacterium]